MGAAQRFVQNRGNTAITYYRYSSDAQRDASIDQQRQAAHDYAQAHGYHIVKEYEDHAVSGTRDDRAGYNLMLYEAEILRPAVLILWKTDRLSRDKIDLVLAKKRLRECGVKIVYVAEAIPDDDDATQVLLESIYEGMAAAFIESHRKNVTRGLTYNAERGLYNGIRMLGYLRNFHLDAGNLRVILFDDHADDLGVVLVGDAVQAVGDDLADVVAIRLLCGADRAGQLRRALFPAVGAGQRAVADHARAACRPRCPPAARCTPCHRPAESRTRWGWTEGAGLAWSARDRAAPRIHHLPPLVSGFFMD